MSRMDVTCALVVLLASTAAAEAQTRERASCATVAGHPQGCYCPQCFAQHPHPQGCYCPICKPCPQPKGQPESAPQPEAAYVRGPAAGEYAGESISIGLTGFGLRLPALNCELPTLKLPSIVLYRRQPEMIVETSRAPYIERGAQEYGRLLGQPESAPAPQPETTPQKEQPEYRLMPMPCNYPYYQQPMPCTAPPAKCVQPPAGGEGSAAGAAASQGIPWAPEPTSGLSPRELQLMLQLQAEQARIQRLESQLQQMQQTVEASLERLEKATGEDEVANASFHWATENPASAAAPLPVRPNEAETARVLDAWIAVPEPMAQAPREQFAETRQPAMPREQHLQQAQGPRPAMPQPQYVQQAPVRQSAVPQPQYVQQEQGAEAKPRFRDRLRSFNPFARN